MRISRLLCAWLRKYFYQHQDVRNKCCKEKLKILYDPHCLHIPRLTPSTGPYLNSIPQTVKCYHRPIIQKFPNLKNIILWLLLRVHSNIFWLGFKSSAVWRVAWWIVLMFRRIISLESSAVNRSNKNLLDPEDEGYMIFRSVGIDLMGSELRNLKCSWRQFEGSACRNVTENIAPTRS